MRPAIKEGLHVGWIERIRGGLQSGRVGARKKPVVEPLEADAIAPKALLDPVVAIEAERHRIRGP
jgi:hypothetical protein